MTVMSSVYQDNLLGRCIHGKDGAKMIRGFLVNLTCDQCEKQGINDRAVSAPSK